ncbi:hypothetical protein [Nocardioides zeicaulis]|uniref:Uncharacterized protein n=1 Tax=Nocardioides zeicaulis TaxID=1776857 RepID=A0ABV6E5J9_9ACTN
MTAPRTTLVLHALLLVLPCSAMALALPEVPHWFVLLGVAVCGVLWTRAPDHPAGVVALVLVAGWWSAHGVLDWRVPVVAVLLLAAHVCAVVLAHGPASLPVDPHLARLWAGRGLLALVPVPVAYAALRGLSAAAAPGWLWLTAAGLTVVALLAAARLTQAEVS